MMNITGNISQETINSFFFSASKLKEDLYVGDLYLDNEGVAKTTIIKESGEVETVTVDKELQEKFNTLCIASASKVEVVMKMKEGEE